MPFERKAMIWRELKMTSRGLRSEPYSMLLASMAATSGEGLEKGTRLAEQLTGKNPER